MKKQKTYSVVGGFKKQLKNEPLHHVNPLVPANKEASSDSFNNTLAKEKASDIKISKA